MNETKDQSGYFLVNRAKGLLVDAVGQVMENTGLPPYIIDGILSGILADLRQKEIYDMGILASIKKKEDEKEDGGQHSDN